MHNDQIDYGYLESRPDFQIDIAKDSKGNYIASSMGIQSTSSHRSIAVSDLEDKLQEMLMNGELNPGGL